MSYLEDDCNIIKKRKCQESNVCARENDILRAHAHAYTVYIGYKANSVTMLIWQLKLKLRKTTCYVVSPFTTLFTREIILFCQFQYRKVFKACIFAFRDNTKESMYCKTFLQLTEASIRIITRDETVNELYLEFVVSDIYKILAVMNNQIPQTPINIVMAQKKRQINCKFASTMSFYPYCKDYFKSTETKINKTLSRRSH